MNPLAEFLFNYSWLVFFLPVGIGVLRWRTLSLSQRLVWVLAFGSLLTEISSVQLVNLFGSNLLLLQGFIVFECLILWGAFRAGDTYAMPRWFEGGLLFGFVGWVIIHTYWGEGMEGYGSMSRLAEAVMLIGMAGTYLVGAIRDDQRWPLSRHALFWVSIGVLGYFCSNFVLFLIARYLPEEGIQIFMYAWAAHGAVTILANLVYSRALLCPSDLTSSP